MKLTSVKAARKSPGMCSKCGQPIDVGAAYVFWAPYRQAKRVRHATAECMPTAADLESNDKKAAAIRANEFVNDARENEDAPHEAASAIRAAIDEVQSIVDSLEESLSNWSGTNFETGEMAENFTTDRDALSEWIDTAGSVADVLENLEEAVDEPGDEPIYPDRDDYEDKSTFNDYDAIYEQEQTEFDEATEAHDEWTSAISSALAELEDVPELSF